MANPDHGHVHVRPMILLYLFSSCNFSLAFGIVGPEVNQGMYIFGDSLVDVGNNDYLNTSRLKANFPHNGIDYGKPTGRFSNGRNSADFLAEKVSLRATPAAYLSLIVNSSRAFYFHRGVSFASGGAGILNTTYYDDSICLENQLGDYTRVHDAVIQQLGSDAAVKHFRKSVFIITIGSNDLFVYFTPASNLTLNTTPRQYVDSMISNLKQFLKRLYNLGSRKFLINGTGAVGCCPAQRLLNNTECREDMNYWSAKYNEGTKTMLQDLKLELQDLYYSFFDTYAFFINILKNPGTYGFTETKAACCGVGNLKAEGFCTPDSTYCPNRSDHLFWDLFHPTQATSAIFAEITFVGSQEYVTPMNLKQLVQLPII